MSLKTLLKETTFENTLDKITDILERDVSIRLDDVSDEYEFLNSGSYASVYSIKEHPDKVIRISQDLEPQWEELVGRDFDNVVKVYYEVALTFCQIVVMEKLQSISNKVGKALRKLDQKELPLEYLIYIFKKRDINDYLDNKVAINTYQSIEHVLKDLSDGMDQLESVGILHTDIHPDNFMYDPKTDKYKLIDIGM